MLFTYQFQLLEYFLEVNKFFFFYASFTFTKNVFLVEFSCSICSLAFFHYQALALKCYIGLVNRKELGIVTILRDLEQVVVLDVGEYFYSMI